MKPLVTVVTATIGTPYFLRNMLSVISQTYSNVQHLVVIDGEHHRKKVEAQMEKYVPSDVLVLPYPTGTDQYNGHRIYAAATYLAKGDYIMYLDEDNWIEPNHVESLVKCLEVRPNSYACSLRKITDMDGNFICNDDCESLGNWPSVLNDHFIDVNCFFFPKNLALQLTPIWYRRARHPEDQPEVDRALTMVLKDNKINCCVSGEYTVNYRAGNRADSVRPEFFIEGNKRMAEKYNGEFPWRK